MPSRLGQDIEVFQFTVIHTVGSYWQGGTTNEAQIFASCYKESLKIAEYPYIKRLTILLWHQYEIY